MKWHQRGEFLMFWAYERLNYSAPMVRTRSLDLYDFSPGGGKAGRTS